jgi:cytochrome c oxidase assembly protein subunit 15
MPADPPVPHRRFTLSAPAYRRVVVAALALLCIIVVSGAAVRLTGSGLGCEDWPNCSSEKFIAAGDVNQAIEQVNRLFTGLVSLSVIAAVLGSLRRRPYRRDLVWLSLGLVAGVLGQIVLGGITVLVDLHPAAVAGHFVLSMVLVADAVVLLWRAGQDPGPRRAVIGHADLTLSRFAVAAACLLMVTGPMVTGSGPHAGDVEAKRFGWFIPDVTRIHSLNMWLFLAILVALMVRLGRSGAPAAVLRRGYRLLVVVVAQGAIGYTQYALGIPAWLVAFHIAGATAVLGLTVWFHLGTSAVDAPPAGPAGRAAPDSVTTPA